jgi:hypothetical protein
MARSKISFAMLMLGTVMAWISAGHAQAPAVPPPAASQPATPDTRAVDNPIGSVATLQGSATLTRNNAASALKVSDTISKGDLLQTGNNGTLGITFDDETTFTLRPNSRITVDDFVYQPGGTKNSALFNVVRGTVAFVASQVAKTGDMKIGTPTATMGIRGTSGLIEIPEGATAGTTGQVAIKLYPDIDGRVGRIEVFGRDGGQLGILTRGASGFAIRAGLPGAAQRFTAVPLQISAQQAARDRTFVRQAASTQRVGRQMNIQRRNLQQPNQQRPNQQRPLTPQRQPGQRAPTGPQRTPALQRQPGQPTLPGRAPALQPQLGQPTAPGPQRGPAVQRRPGLPTLPGLARPPAAQKKPVPGKPPAKRTPPKKKTDENR